MSKRVGKRVRHEYEPKEQAGVCESAGTRVPPCRDGSSREHLRSHAIARAESSDSPLNVILLLKVTIQDQRPEQSFVVRAFERRVSSRLPRVASFSKFTQAERFNERRSGAIADIGERTDK